VKVAILSRWNTACGVSLHAELVGREWVKEGHSLTVFAPNNIRPVGEDEEWVPLEPLIRCFSQIKKKAKTVYVVHERRPPTNPLFYQFDWDAIVCFDDRYKSQWLSRFDEAKIHIIPYPTGYLCKGDKQKARGELNLPGIRG